jgi:acyl transferase domain-containing protein
MSGRYPGSRNLDEFWANLRDGVDLVSSFTREELEARGVDASLLDDPHFVRAASVLEDVEMFDASFFGFMKREAEMLDPQHRLFLECAWEALENAGCCPFTYKGLISVFAGAGVNTYFLTNLLSNPKFGPLDQLSILLTSDKDYMMTRVSYKLNLRGPSVMVASACSTSLVAVHMACQSLLNEESDIALAGASMIQLRQRYGYYAFEGGVYSPDGRCRSFDASGRGTIFGSGVGVVVLKRLEDALADGDHIEGIIIGSAINNDGSEKVSYTAPGVEGQSQVIAEALANAGVSADTISYVEAHGTATPLGDSIEIQALTKAFRASTDKNGFCAVGSVKSNLGHLDAAAGVTGLIKTVLSLKHRLIPPSLHFKEPNPAIDFDNSPFFVNNSLSPWQGHSPARAGVSSFGIGGTNAHIVLEAPPAAAPAGPSRPWQLLVMSARSGAALETMTGNLKRRLKDDESSNLADVAYTLQVGRKVFNHRRMFVCKDIDDAVSALEAGDSRRIITAVHEPARRLVVFMFPGQGTQHADMGRGFYESEPVFRQHIDECSELIRFELGLDIREILYRGEASSEAARQLQKTSLAQPALFIVEYALARLWQSWGVVPRAMIGHSIGEYVAACLADVFSLEDALKLVAARGRLMQELPAGAMLAVSTGEQEIRSLIGEGISLAAINAPDRCVVSGSPDAVEALEHLLGAKGLACSRLHTSHAFHSGMMEPILEPFKKLVKRLELRGPQTPFISNVTGTWITQDETTDPNYWANHLRTTVRFGDGLSELLNEPSTVLLEVGPGKVLGTLAKQQAQMNTQQTIIHSMRSARDSEPDATALLRALGQLWILGAEIDWQGFYSHEKRHKVALPTYPFERKRYWVDAPDTNTIEAQGENLTHIELPGSMPPLHQIKGPSPVTLAARPTEPVGPASRLSEAKQHAHGNGGHGPGTQDETQDSALAAIVAQQLQVMARQLRLLRSRPDRNGSGAD